MKKDNLNHKQVTAIVKKFAYYALQRHEQKTTPLYGYGGL